MDWEGKKVTVMGLGLLGGGVGSARYVAERGAHVTVTDLRDVETLAPSLQQLRDLSLRYVLGEHREEDFQSADVVIRNPGVQDSSPYLAIARRAGASIESEASIFLRSCPSFLIGVTGTKGKSSTASFIAEGFRVLDVPVLLTGVPGTSLCQALEDLEKNPQQVAVVEFSSWDLEVGAVAKKSPHVAILTNLFPDHLNRHKTMEAYRDAKALLIRYQTAGDTVILLHSNQLFLDLFRQKAPPGKIKIVGEEAVAAMPPLFLPGRHQRENAALALTAIRISAQHPQFVLTIPEDIGPSSEAIARFRGLPGRLEFLGEREGRRFLNDTAATNPGASCAALDALSGPVVLIAGGENKGLVYDELAERIVQKVKHLVLFSGSASETVLSLLKGKGFFAITENVMTMGAAVAHAWQASAEGDTILLSPGAASFNLFENEFDRGKQFIDAFRNLHAPVSV